MIELPVPDRIDLIADPRAAATVFYDEGCPVCRREIGWYRGMRGGESIRWKDVADPACAVPPGLDRAAMLRRFTVVRRDGTAATGAAGFAALWRALGPTRLFGRIVDRPPLLWVAESAYRLFLRIRTTWR